MLWFGIFFMFVVPLLCGFASYGRHESVPRAILAAVGGLLVLPAIVGLMCASGTRPAPRNEWF